MLFSSYFSKMKVIFGIRVDWSVNGQIKRCFEVICPHISIVQIKQVSRIVTSQVSQECFCFTISHVLALFIASCGDFQFLVLAKLQWHYHSDIFYAYS